MTPSSSVVSVSAYLDHSILQAGRSYKVLVEIDHKEGWHSQSHNPSAENLIATTLELKPDEGLSTGRIFYPEGKMLKFGFSDDKISVYEGKTYIGTSIAISQDLPSGEYSVSGDLTIQACNDQNCLMPSNVKIDIPVTVGTQSEPVHSGLFAANKELFLRSHVEAEPAGKNEIEGQMKEKGLLLTFIFIFLGGLALNLTPCVYPLIPITLSYFGGQSSTRRGSTVLHAILYLLGMAAMYSVLGLFASLTGSLFGALLQNPIVTLGIVALLVALSLSMFGLYDISMPSSLMNLGGKSRSGLFGTFLMGLTVGIIAAPCIGPFVLGLLAFVGERQDPLLGFSMFFVLALGLGLPFVFLAIFSSSISSLPRSGDWMVWVRKVFGIILLLMALYFLRPLLPEGLYGLLTSVFMVLSGIYLFFAKVKKAKAGFWVAKGLVAIAFIGAGLFVYSTSMEHHAPSEAIVWKKASMETLDAALASGRPVVLEFSAEWCIPCKELEHFTFTDKEAIKASARFEMIKVDLTDSADPVAGSIKDRFKISGVPTIMFFGKNGKLRNELTTVGFIEAGKFVGKMNAAEAQ